MTIGPGASGWAGWKEALWALNYLQVMHDPNENGRQHRARRPARARRDARATRSSATAGPERRPCRGRTSGRATSRDSRRRTSSRSSTTRREQWLTALTTTDGATLGWVREHRRRPRLQRRRARSRGSLEPSPSRRRRTRAASRDPASYTIASPDSDLLDLAGMLGAFSSIYALTDQSNTQTGGAQPALAYFDGDPFPVQNQTPTGAPTLHDRALAMMRVAGREHGLGSTSIRRRGSSSMTSTLAGGNVVERDDAVDRHGGVRAPVAPHRAARARLAARPLQQHEAGHAGGPLPARLVPGRATGSRFGARLDALIESLSSVFYDKLTTADGLAYGGWNLRQRRSDRRRDEPRRALGGDPRPARRVPRDRADEVPRSRGGRLRAARERLLRSERARVPADAGRHVVDA